MPVLFLYFSFLELMARTHCRRYTTKVAQVIMTPKMMASLCLSACHQNVYHTLHPRFRHYWLHSALPQPWCAVHDFAQNRGCRDGIRASRAVLPDTPADEEIGMQSLLQGFEATVPSADAACARHHATHNVSSPRLGPQASFLAYEVSWWRRHRTRRIWLL